MKKKRLKTFMFRNKINGSIRVYKDYHGADATMQLIIEVGDAHTHYEIL